MREELEEENKRRLGLIEEKKEIVIDEVEVEEVGGGEGEMEKEK